jgi:hypothetical protein
MSNVPIRRFFDVLFTHAFPQAQPDLFLAEEIARLKIAPPDDDFEITKEAAN